MNTHQFLKTPLYTLDSSAHLCHNQRDENRCLVRLTNREVLELAKVTTRIWALTDTDPDVELDVFGEKEAVLLIFRPNEIAYMATHADEQAPSTLDDWAEFDNILANLNWTPPTKD